MFIHILDKCFLKLWKRGNTSGEFPEWENNEFDRGRLMKTYILKMESEILIIEKCIIWSSDQEDMMEIALPSLVLFQDHLSLPGLEF